MKSPMLVFAGAFALGILVAFPSRGGAFVWLLLCAISLLCGAIALRRVATRACLAFVLLGFFSAGGACAVLFPNRFPQDHISHLSQWGLDLERPVLLEGRLASNPILMPDGLQADLEVSRVSDARRVHRALGIVRLRIYNGRRSSLPIAALHLDYGVSIRALARLRPPRNDHNPGGFNYQRWIESIHDIYWQGAVDGTSGVARIPGPPAPLIRRLIEQARVRLLESIDSLFPPWSVRGKDGAVLKAVLLGDRSSLDSSTIEDFRKSGLYHLLVVAGLHVGLLALLAEGLLRLLRMRESWRAALLLLLLVVYAALVEQRASTLRASLMIGAYLLARLFDRSQPALNAIGLAALVLLLSRPAWLFDAGFELSFAAALLIAAVAAPVLARLTEPYRRGLKHLDEPLYDLACEPRVAQFRLDVRAFSDSLGDPAKRRTRLRTAAAALRISIWLADLVIFSAILQLGLMLPMAAFFHRITLSGIGLNTLAVPLMTVLLAVAVPVVLLNLALPAICAPLAKLLAIVMEGLFALTRLPHLPQWLSFRVPAPPGWIGLGFALGLVVVALGLAHSGRLAKAGAACCIAFGLAIALSPFPPALPSGEFQATALNCGGGEALLLVLPGGRTVLVGAGGGGRPWAASDPIRARRWDPGDSIVSPYLWSRHLQSLDVMLLSDSHTDYLRGSGAVIRNFHPSQIWLASGQEPSALQQAAFARSAEMRELRPGITLDIGGTAFTNLWEGSASSPGAALVRVSNSDGSILLAANLTLSSQTALLRTKIPLRSTVLEANAGELTPAFLARVQPDVVLEIRAGRTKSERAPAGDPSFGRSRVYRIASQGAVTVSMRKGVALARKDY